MNYPVEDLPGVPGFAQIERQEINFRRKVWSFTAIALALCVGGSAAMALLVGR